MRQADSIRTFVLQNYVESARGRGDRFVTVRAGDVHKAMGLRNKMPAVCSAIRARKFEQLSRVELVEAKGPAQGSNLYLTFKLLRAEEAPRDWCDDPRGSQRMTRIQHRVDALLDGFGRWIQQFEQAERFTGPSLYFHVKTITVLREQVSLTDALDNDCFWDLLYGTLTSWGLHRMGRTWTKLRDLSDIRESFDAQRPCIERLDALKLSSLSDEELGEVTSLVWGVMDALRVGIGDTKLIANSKALHHVLPNLVPPIDRQYILRFFYGHTNINRAEEKIFREMYPQYHRIGRAGAAKFPHLLGKGMHTSETKIIDNAIVGFVLAEREEQA